MGMSVKDVELLIRLKEDGHIPTRAAVIEIGAQQLSNSVLRAKGEVEKLGQLFGVHSAPPLSAPVPTVVEPSGYERLSPESPLARDLWTWLGFSYASIDIDGSPGAIALDLNFDDVPDVLAGKHQLVTNFGTTEHVVNQLNAFKIVHDLAAPGGVMMHNLPSQGGFNHGLINYTPKFFWALARSNNYRWLHFGFSPDPTMHLLPDNVIASVRPFSPEIGDAAATYRFAECSIAVAFQKRGDAPYVPPIDVPTGTVSRVKEMLARYWSVLKHGS